MIDIHSIYYFLAVEPHWIVRVGKDGKILWSNSRDQYYTFDFGYEPFHLKSDYILNHE